MASEPPEEKVDVGRVLGRGFAALRDNFLPFLAVSLLLAGLPAAALQYWAQSNFDVADPGFVLTGGYWAVLGATLLANIVSAVLLQGVLTRSTILHLGGRDADIGASALLALRLLPALIAVSLLLGLMIAVGAVLLVFPGLMIYCATLVAVPALIEERPGILGSISRSRDLTRGSRWRIFLIALLFWFFSAALQSIVALISGVSMVDASQPAVDPLRAGIAAGISASLSTMIVATVTAALYVELREVREGATTNELADVFA
jgi:hypothetical protein